MSRFFSLSRQAPLQRIAPPGEDHPADQPGADIVVSIAFASDLPYERWWGIEILDCSPEAVRLDRLNDGAAILYNHNWNDLRGHHVPQSVVADGHVVRGDAIISWACDEGKTIALITGNHLTKASVGYEVHAVVEQTTTKSGDPISRNLDGRLFGRVLERCQREAPGDLAVFRRALDHAAGPLDRAADAPTTYRVIDWEPLENSLVTVPADASVGVGRMADRDTAPPQTPASIPEPIPQGARQVTPEEIAALKAAATADALQRIKNIESLAKQFESFGLGELPAQAIRNGTSAEDFTKQLMAHVAQRGQAWTPEIGLSAQEVKRYSIVRAIRAMLANDWSGAGLEREASNAFAAKAQQAGLQRQAENSFFLPMEVQRRDMTVGTTTAGGHMVATTLRPQDFIELLRNATLLKSLGARTLSGLVGNADITKQTGAATGYWLSTEATAITESQQTIGLLQLRPKVLGAYTEISRLLLQQSTPDADMFVMEDLAQVLGVALDAAGINVGGSGAPVGILGTGSIGAFTGTTLGLAALLDAQVDVAGANALHPGCAYLTTPTVASLLAQRQRFASTDTPLWKGNILEGEVLGFKAVSTNQMPAATAIFGDFRQVIFAEWGALELAANPYANFPAGITGIRAFLTADVGVRIAGAFSASSSIT
jgi:HK97 family phage major capsid protein